MPGVRRTRRRPLRRDTRAHPASSISRLASDPALTADAEEMGKSSFPASDPPAVWTWELPNASGRKR